MPTFPIREERIGRLRAGLQGTNMRTASGPSEDFHLFTSIALHALGRKRRGKAPLSKLEAWTMGLFDTVVDGDDELDAYIEAVSSARRSKSGGGWLTTATLSLGDDEPYTVERLRKDIASKRIGVQGSSPQFDANVRMIDPLTGERIGLDNEAFEAASAQAGRSTTVFWSEPEASVNSNNTMSSVFKGPRVKLQPTFHYCIKESGEVGKDEIYYSLASGADSGDHLASKHVTSEIGSVKTDSWHDFPSSYALFDGRVDHTLSAHIVCWEADHSNSKWYRDLIDVSYAISKKSTEMQVISGDPIWDELLGQLPGYSMRNQVLFWVQHISKLVGDFLSIFTNHDDKVAEAYMSWNLPALDHMFMGNSKYETAVRFNGGGGGDHRLYIIRVRQHDNYPGHVVTTLESGDLTSWNMTRGNNVNGIVAMEGYGGILYSAVAFDKDGYIAVSDKLLIHDDVQRIGTHSVPTRVDIVADGRSLTLAAQGLDQRLWFFDKLHTSSSWTASTFGDNLISKAPNICILNSTIVCIFVTFDSKHVWMKRPKNSWGDYYNVQAHTPSPYPAGACAFRDAIYYFYADTHFKIRVAIIYGHEIEQNTPSIVDYGLSPFETKGGISAAVWRGKIYIAYSTVNPDRRPCIDRYEVDQQRLVSVRVFDDWCPAGDPALGVDNGRLRLTYRKP